MGRNRAYERKREGDSKKKKIIEDEKWADPFSRYHNANIYTSANALPQDSSDRLIYVSN